LLDLHFYFSDGRGYGQALNCPTAGAAGKSSATRCLRFSISIIGLASVGGVSMISPRWTQSVHYFMSVSRQAGIWKTVTRYDWETDF